jgi:pimeloyl-ACP methyl ester carboxylesterase
MAAYSECHGQQTALNGWATLMLTIVLLPGMDGTGKLFSEFVAALPESLGTVTVRCPANERLSYGELEDVVRTALPTSEPFLLLAESFSTPLAIRCAATHPPNLAGIVVCAGFASSPVVGLRRFVGRLLAPHLFHLPLPSFAAKRWLIGPDAPSSLLSAVRDAISSVQPGVLAARLRAVLKCDVRTDLSQIDVPILYLQAKGDRLVGASCLEEVRRFRPQVKVVSIEGPHLLLQRQPHRSAEAVVKFAHECCPDWIA